VVVRTDFGESEVFVQSARCFHVALGVQHHSGVACLSFGVEDGLRERAPEA
jgi:hypothetical protein